MMLERSIANAYKAWPCEAWSRGCIRAKRQRVSAGTWQSYSYTTSVEVEKQKRDQDRDTLISVLEAAATKRDAKQYLKTFAADAGQAVDLHKGKLSRSPLAHVLITDSPRAVSESPRFVQGRREERQAESPTPSIPHVAIVKFVSPQSWDDDTLKGVSKTLGRLRMLGLGSVVILDFSPPAGKPLSPDWRTAVSAQLSRVEKAFATDGKPGAQVRECVLVEKPDHAVRHQGKVSVEFGEAMLSILQAGHTAVLPSVAYSEEGLSARVIDADEAVLALTKYFSGLQLSSNPEHSSSTEQIVAELPKYALVDRIIVLDTLGGVPRHDLAGAAMPFINLEQEFSQLKSELASREDAPNPRRPSQAMGRLHGVSKQAAQQRHISQLELAKYTLAMLPPAASAVITTPTEAANLSARGDDGRALTASAFVGSVGTRKKQNPLIHNLLTDRPVYSSSLPPGRIVLGGSSRGDLGVKAPSGTTLLKRGMPVTIFPDPRTSPWLPPEPGSPRLRLTDMCIDLTRLVYLIEDSFNRKLDVEDYLRRVENSIAGVIVAGEYEGGAILTWERPGSGKGGDANPSYGDSRRLVPYLDKFAVLKKSQGAGGVADLVFNAMVRDCFPTGVCWRSRRDNPVNRWYFERSRGTWKLRDSNWSMFWTTEDVALDQQRMRDYEDVCRSVVPSWADAKQPAD